MTNDADVTAGHPEVCFNLWAFADQDTGIIMRISGKAYVLPGSEVEKRALLSHLAATDFYSVAWHQVPKHLVMVNPAGSEVHVSFASAMGPPGCQQHGTALARY